MSRERAERDPLTGLFHRKVFEDRFQEESERVSREKGALSVGFIDIDHFKLCNDTHGHQQGDRVIRKVADTIRSIVGDAGIAARYGGEEFAVLLPGVEREQAFLLLERIRATLETHPDQPGGGETAVPREIVRKADHALYRAKTTGRNRVCIAQEERMATKTSHYTITQLERLAKLAREEGVGEAVLLREALDDLLTKHKVCDVES
jgi:diguanylate cyclase